MEVLQVVKEFLSELMVMSDSRSLYESFSFDLNNPISFEDLHRSVTQIENPSISQFFHPPSTLHDPISQSLEKSYLTSSIVKHIFFSFFMFDKLRSSKDFSHMSCCYDVHKHHNPSPKFLACALFLYFYACTFTL